MPRQKRDTRVQVTVVGGGTAYACTSELNNPPRDGVRLFESENAPEHTERRRRLHLDVVYVEGKANDR